MVDLEVCFFVVANRELGGDWPRLLVFNSSMDECWTLWRYSCVRTFVCVVRACLHVCVLHFSERIRSENACTQLIQNHRGNLLLLLVFVICFIRNLYDYALMFICRQHLRSFIFSMFERAIWRKEYEIYIEIIIQNCWCEWMT